ncbi:glycosyltransferase family 2 protein [Holdemania filiformis]|uniref:Glycosyltransferase family 2 protein n=1 Tax=Holdemania filiformis TaxID=61171 RepID=A0A412FY33_9FIRM|nr:glycosyltransferase family 2 protein [Holdemania filiformis]RGR73077.1 glycosyltransferase family 2 protein [Holdemania filiformis]
MNLNTPLISIILPLYNVENYLPKCMESLINQTYENIEIVMVDDGSDSVCAKLCDDYLQIDGRVKVFHKKNGGLSDARNYGIERASGEFIACIDPDDYVDLDYIEYLFKLIKKYNTKMSVCQHRICYSNGKVIELNLDGSEILCAEKALERMLYNDVIDTSAWAKLYHISLFDKIRYPKGKIFEDIGTTYLFMIQSEDIAIGYESKYNYVIRSNSIVNSNFNENKLQLLEMTDKMSADVVEKYPLLNRAVLRRMVYARFSTLNQMLDITTHKKEKKEIIKFVKSHSFDILSDKKAPTRDKVAVVILNVSYPLYKLIWSKYRKRKMKE